MSIDLPPRCAGRFHAIRSLGEGSFGVVWLTTQVELNRLAAVKLLRPEYSLDPTEIGRFLDEARITGGLSHPNIVVIYDHDVESDIPWIAYEYLQGPSLRQEIVTGPMEWRRAVSIMIQVTHALEEAHSKNILHRDIKPGNVLRSGPETYKVTDFGLAKALTGGPVRTRTGAIVGTPSYMAPELILDNTPSVQSDIFAVGATLFEIVTGRLPFEIGPGKSYWPQLTGPVAPPSRYASDLPRLLDDIVVQALAPEPKKRFESAAAMREAFLRVLATKKRRGFSRPSSNETIREGLASTALRRDGDTVRARPHTRKTLLLPVLTSVALSVIAVLVMFHRLSPDGRTDGQHPSAHRSGETREPMTRGESRTRTAPSATASINGESSTAGTSLNVRGPMFDRLVIVPLSPRSVRLEYTLRPVPASALPFRIEALSAGQRTAHPIGRGVLSRASGVLIEHGLTPGERYEFQVDGTPTQKRTFTMPRPLICWLDVIPSMTHAIVNLHALEPATFSLEVARKKDGAIVFRERVGPSWHFRRVIPSLDAATGYVLRLRPLEGDVYIAPTNRDVDFATRELEHSQAMKDAAQWLQSSDPLKRWSTARFFEQVLDPATVPEALQTLKMTDARKDFETVNKLSSLIGHCHDPVGLQSLCEIFDQIGDPGQRNSLVKSIGRINDPKAFDFLAERGRRGLLPINSDVAARFAFALLSTDPSRAIPLFRQILREPGRHSSFESLVALHGSSRARLTDVAGLVATLATNDPKRFATHSARVLASLGTHEARLGVRRIATSLASKPTPAQDLFEVALALGQIGQTEDVTALIPYLEKSYPSLVRQGAVIAIGLIGGSRATRPLVTHLTDSDIDVRRAAIRGVGRLKIPEAVATLLGFLGQGRGSFGLVPRALGQIGDPRAVEPLLRALRSSVPKVVPGREMDDGFAQELDTAESLWALGRLGSPRALKVLQDGLISPSLSVRFRAAEGAGWLGHKEALGPLERVRTRSGESPLVVGAAASAIEWIRTGRKPRGNPIVVDPGFPWERTGIDLVIGDQLHVEVLGLVGKAVVSRGEKTTGSGFTTFDAVTERLAASLGPLCRLGLAIPGCQSLTNDAQGELRLSLEQTPLNNVAGPWTKATGPLYLRPPTYRPGAVGFATVWITRE